MSSSGYHRTKLDSVGLDLSLNKASEVGFVGQTDNSAQAVVEALSKPVSIYNYDIVADEVAEIIAKHTSELRASDGSNTSIATFKSVVPSNAPGNSDK